IAADVRAFSARPDERVTRQELMRTANDRARCVDVTEGEVLVDRLRIEIPLARASCDERVELGRECQLAVPLDVEQRLLPESIAREEETSALRVPDRERELALDRMQELWAVVLVEVDEHLRVRLGDECVPALEEMRAQRAVV